MSGDKEKTPDSPYLPSLSSIVYSVLPEEDTSTLPSFFSTTSPGVLPTDVYPVAPTNQNQANKFPLEVGLALGLLALVVGALCYRYRRRPVVPDVPPVSPYIFRPMRQPEPQSRLLRDGKRSLQVAPPSGAPMDTGDPPISPHVNQLGPPPSYESPIHGWRVGVPQ